LTTCYIDESGTDSNLPIAVVAGLLLDHEGSFWLDVEWAKVKKRCGIDKPIHMREFTPNGEFKDLNHDTRRALLSDLVAAINQNKLLSLAATLTSKQYRQHFKGITKLSMYAACFTKLALLSGIGIEKHGPHRWPLSFILDDGNHYRSQIIESKAIILSTFPRVADITFDSDKQVNALQAADVLSWAVRRHLSGDSIAHGCEPVQNLFDEHHLNITYEEEWMKGIADKIRALEFVDTDPIRNGHEDLYRSATHGNVQRSRRK